MTFFVIRSLASVCRINVFYSWHSFQDLQISNLAASDTDRYRFMAVLVEAPGGEVGVAFRVGRGAEDECLFHI